MLKVAMIDVTECKKKALLIKKIMLDFKEINVSICGGTQND